jgi:predicted SprT family Zn-dependent metalloprotease
MEVVMTELQIQAIEQTHFWIDLANEIYDLDIAYPTVSFKLRGKTAGQARSNYGNYEIRYNAVLLE